MQDRQTPKPTPVVKRAVFAFTVLAVFAAGMFLSMVLLPQGTSYMDGLEVEVPIVVTLAGSVADLFAAWWWALGAGSLLLCILAWMGGLDAVLKPGIAAGLVALLLLVGMCASVWNTNDTLLRLFGETAAPR